MLVPLLSHTQVSLLSHTITTMNTVWLILWLLTVCARGQHQRCKEEQFSETRKNYEICASNKIQEITSWLQREEGEGEKGELEEEGVTAVCMAVRDLIYECGNTLSLCFSDSQVRDIMECDDNFNATWEFLNILVFLYCLND